MRHDDDNRDLSDRGARPRRKEYTWVAPLDGAGRAFLLSMIILMPTVTPWVKRRLEGK